MAGEKAVRDESRNFTELGFLYTQTLTQNQNTNQSGVRVIRTTGEGFEVAGHAHFVVDPPTPFTTPLPTISESREYDIRERNAVLITVENNQDGAVTIDINGRHTSTGVRFLLGTISLAAGAKGMETLSDPFAFLSLDAKSDTGGQSGAVIIKVQEQT